MNDTYSVYVHTDEDNNIIAVNSSDFINDVTGWIKIGEGVGDKYLHCQHYYFEKPTITENGVYRYKLINDVVVEKTAQEIATEESTISIQPTTEEIQNNMINMLVDYEYRLTLLEV